MVSHDTARIGTVPIVAWALDKRLLYACRSCPGTGYGCTAAVISAEVILTLQDARHAETAIRFGSALRSRTVLLSRLPQRGPDLSGRLHKKVQAATGAPIITPHVTRSSTAVLALYESVGIRQSSLRSMQHSLIAG